MEKNSSVRHIVSLKTVYSWAIVESCQTEREVIIRWCQFINKLDPDVLLGYNIFSFDYPFIWETHKN